MNSVVFDILGEAKWLALLIMIIVMDVLISVAYIRVKFVEGSKIATLLGIVMDPRMVTIVFLSINMLIFMVATIVVFLSHTDVVDEMKREQYHYKRIMKKTQELLNLTSENLKALYKVRLKSPSVEYACFVTIFLISM